MPKGFTQPARLKGGPLTVGSAAVAAAGLIMVSAPAAQSAPAPGTAHVAVSNPVYPTPGQPATSEPSAEGEPTTVEKGDDDLRVATLHTGLTASDPEDSDPLDALIGELAGGNHSEARTVAETAQINQPDVLVLTGVSYDEDGRIAEILKNQYLASGQNGQSGQEYSHVFTAPTNSGIDSGVDLDGDGTVGGPGDAMGYGQYPGEEGIIIFSKEPLDTDGARTFREFLWQDLPGSSLQDEDFTQAEESILRLASTTLWDVPVLVEDGEPVHLIATATAAPEDPGPLEEIRSEDMAQLISDYVSSEAWYLYDDEGAEGGLAPGADAVVVGEPSFSEETGLERLTGHPVLEDPEPEAVTEAELLSRSGPVAQTDATATRWVDGGEDQRASVVLPSSGLDVSGSGIFWPGEGEFGYETVDPSDPRSLEDRLVWLDITSEG
ncbi:hypothetical protein [Nesterenkonia populi]